MKNARISKRDALDRRFAIVDSEGVKRYPYQMEKSPGQRGFVLGRDRHGLGKIVQTVEDVVKGVVLDGLSARMSDDPPTKGKGANSLSLFGTGDVQGYLLAPELMYLVQSSKVAPLGAPGMDLSTCKGVRVQGEAKPNPSLVSSLGKLAKLVAADYIKALNVVLPQATEKQREMLVGHASSVDQTLSMEAIAHLVGFDSFNSANIQYGLLGRTFSEYFGISGLVNQVQAIAVAAETTDSAGHWQWKLRQPLFDALVTLGWVEPVEAPSELIDVANEVDSDPKSQGISETTRKALINARIGQGGYRRRLLQLWYGRCSLSGCQVEAVLVASHIKAWKDSSNDQRLDEFNGLLLAASIDRLFDSGLISFLDDGTLIKQPSLDWLDLADVGLQEGCKLRALHARNRPYLRDHRIQHGFEQLVVG